MKHHERDEWMRDLEDRQRNIVFPDTVRNEGRFWRNLYSGKQPLNRLQWAGLVLFFASTVLALVLALAMIWPTGEEPWWQKAFSAYGLRGVIAALIILFVVHGNRKMRKKMP